MADEIIVSYKAVPSGFDKVGAAVNSVTADTKELQNQIKATFADKSIDEATVKLQEQEAAVAELVQQYGGASKVLKQVEKDLVALSLAGKANSEEYKALAKEAANLKDTIGDTRNEIKKMASDTRVFDTMVQGARGIAAAFSVATGVAAAFGSQNKDLEKALLKVQGAMAALQGVQELANIATEKGGIATKAYGVALQVVDKISKVTGLSMAASWALATGGITLVIAGIVSLISYFKDAEEASSDFAAAEKKRYDEYKKQEENRREAIKIIVDVEKKALEESDRMYERRRKQAILDDKDLAVVELGILQDKLNESEALLVSAREREKQGYDAGLIAYRKSLEDRILDTKVAYKKIFDTIKKGSNNTPQVSPTENVTPMNTVGPLVTTEVVDMNKRNAEQMNADLKQYAFDKSIKDMQAFRAQMFDLAGQGVSAIASFANAIFEQQTQNINEQEQKQLKAAGDNAKAREKIERDFAIKKATIERNQAISNKVFASFDIALRTAQAIMRAYSDAGPIAGAPLAAIAAAIGAVQIAAIAAQPLPTIPKFEKGGAVVLAGGRSDDGMLWGRSHSEGGMLINAQGGEYIWDIPTVKKHGDLIKAAHENRLEDLILHKYIAPSFKAPSASSENGYDDWLLRATIKAGHKENRKNAEHIANKVSKTVSEALYNQNRYR